MEGVKVMGFDGEKKKECWPKNKQDLKNKFFTKCASQLAFDLETLNMDKPSPEVVTGKKLGSIKEMAETFYGVTLNVDV